MSSKQKYCLWGLLVLCVWSLPFSIQAQDVYQLYAPPTPTSIPLLLAARNMENLEVTIFSNHSQANTLFLRGDIDILVTGLSVGMNFFQNQVPVQMLNSYISGLTYLVTRGKQVQNFREIQGKQIYIPFEGSPIEEITRFFAEQEGLIWGTDLKPVYAPFPSSLELLKKGQADVVALPQPLATIAATDENIFLSLSYTKVWNTMTDSQNGYPQVGAFVKTDWAARHNEIITELHQELGKALELIAANPQEAVALTKEKFQFPEKVLLASLGRIDFLLVTSEALKQDVSTYYQTIGRPLDETFDAFFYLDPQ